VSPHGLLPIGVTDCYYKRLMTSTIILLNGVGSAGKSSLAKALQEILPAPFLHIQMDTFFEMMPKKLQNHSQGFLFEETTIGGKASIKISEGPFGAQVMIGMRSAIKAMADTGNNLIIDDVILDDGFSEYQRLLAPFELLTVGVHASLETLEARERERGDRLIGLARWQYDLVHHGKTYDLDVNTETASPAEIAHQAAALI
jgi:chloramphenicol 3-O phosphotransferase